MIIDFLKDKPKPEGKKRLVTLKLTGEELLLLRVKAAQFTDGNVSEWMRYSAIHLLPPTCHIDFGADADPDEMEFYGPQKDEHSKRYKALHRELKAFAKKFEKFEQEYLKQKEQP